MLNVRTGRLYKSWTPNPVTSKDSKSILKITPTGSFDYEIESLLPYATIQNEGGFIKSKGKMHKYFFAMFYEFKNIFFKIMALSVLERGGVQIRATNYFTNTVKSFRKKYKQNTELFIRDLIDEINKSDNIMVDVIAQKFKSYAQQTPYDFSIEMADNMKLLDFATAKKLNDPLTMRWV